MTQFLMEPAELTNESGPIKGGLLDAALPAPPGWQHGLAVPFYGCGEPIVRDKCVSATDVPHRTAVAEFEPFPIEQGATCSTMGRQDQAAHARYRLESTSEWAVAQQFSTDLVGNGSPSLADATVLGTVAAADFVTALGCLEQAAADAGFGTQWWVHAPVRAAAYLSRFNLVLPDRLTPGGGRLVVSPGYAVQGPTTVRLWVTGPVWVGLDEPDVHAAVDWRVNDDSAWALRAGLVAFDPCLNLAIDVTVPACPTP